MTAPAEIKVTAPEASVAAFDTALRAAGMSPQIRLEMILGEAYQKYVDVLRWLREEIEKDEKKVPGLANVAAISANSLGPSHTNEDPEIWLARMKQREILRDTLALKPHSCDDDPKLLTQERPDET